MQINTISKTKAQVISKTATPYSVNGASGTTYRVAVLLNDDVEKIKVQSEELYDQIQKGSAYFLEFAIVVSNGSVREPKICGVYDTNPLATPAGGKQ